MKLNKIIIAGLIVLTLVATSITAFAFTSDQQTTYDEGLWEEYRQEMLENKKAFLDEKVKEGALTQEEADTYYSNMQERHEYFSNGSNGYGGMMGYGFGNNNGPGRGMGFGPGRGCGRGW